MTESDQMRAPTVSLTCTCTHTTLLDRALSVSKLVPPRSGFQTKYPWAHSRALIGATHHSSPDLPTTSPRMQGRTDTLNTTPGSSRMERGAAMTIV